MKHFINSVKIIFNFLKFLEFIFTFMMHEIDDSEKLLIPKNSFLFLITWKMLK